MKRAVVFHEKAVPTKTNENEIACIIDALPKHQWELPTGGHEAHRSFIDRLNESIETMEQDIEKYSADLEYSDSDLSYDQGYLAGLQQALKMYKED